MLFQEYERMIAEPGASLRTVARKLGRNPGYFSGQNSLYARWQRGGAAGLVRDGRAVAADGEGLARQTLAVDGVALPGWFIAAAKFFYMHTNATKRRGSVPEAVRRVISLPACPPCHVRRLAAVLGAMRDGDAETRRRGPAFAALRRGKDAGLPECPAELREAILARQQAGRPLVPPSIADAIRVGAVQTQYHRNQKDAALDYINAAGCLKFIHVNGEYAPLQAGQRLTADDGSINFCCWVPWGFPTNACARKYGVMVGRWQLLIIVDCLSLKITARMFVARPKQSYRQEDTLKLFNIHFRQYGLPVETWHEGGAWNGKRMHDMFDQLGIRRHLTWSPHQKAVEGRFNKLWTVLSALSAGQIGRYRGEMEAENKILTSCQQGFTDPRRVFPSLQQALELIDQAIAEANATPVHTDVGIFTPDEIWAERAAGRQLEPDTAWMFSPFALERQVRGGVTAKIPLFPDFSVPFTWASAWLPKFTGARVRCYFDPWSESRGESTVVLLSSFEGCKAGEVLGTAHQTNDLASYTRLMMGYGSGPDDLGRKLRTMQTHALRSERAAILGKAVKTAGPELGHQVSEVRNGMFDQQVIVEREGKGGDAETRGHGDAENETTEHTEHTKEAPREDAKPREEEFCPLDLV